MAYITPRREPSLYRPRPVQPSRLSDFAEGCAWAALVCLPLGVILCLIALTWGGMLVWP